MPHAHMAIGNEFTRTHSNRKVLGRISTDCEASATQVVLSYCWRGRAWCHRTEPSKALVATSPTNQKDRDRFWPAFNVLCKNKNDRSISRAGESYNFVLTNLRSSVTPRIASDRKSQSKW